MQIYSSNSSLQATQLTCELSDRLLFRDLSFTLNPGEMLYVTGPNGSGKSSLLRLLTGLLQPLRGHVFWCGQAITQCRSRYNDQLIFMGHRLNVNGHLTVKQNIEFITALSGIYPTSLNMALDQVKLTRFENELAHSLSAGQQRRIMLARLITRPAQIWMLDEPTTSLDKESHAWLETQIHQHLKNKGMVVLASHHALVNQHFSGQHLELLGNGQYHFV